MSSDDREKIVARGLYRLDGRCYTCGQNGPSHPSQHCSSCWSNNRVVVRGKEVLTLLLPFGMFDVSFGFDDVEGEEVPEVVETQLENGDKQQIRIHRVPKR